MHQTVALEAEDEGAEQCAASITFQWVGPLASKYLRSHLPRILMSGSAEQCWGQWEHLITLTPEGQYVKLMQRHGLVTAKGAYRKWSTTAMRTKISRIVRTAVKYVFEKADKNRDDKLSLDEIVAFVKTKAWRDDEKFASGQAHESHAEDMLAFQVGPILCIWACLGRSGVAGRGVVRGVDHE